MQSFSGGRGARNGGFSLLELMVVTAIVAILAAVAIPAYSNHMMRSRQTMAIGELMAIKASEERYFAENGWYAGKLSRLDKYSEAGTYYTNGFYRYFIPADTLRAPAGEVIRAEGDLNGDGNFFDVWEVTIDNVDDKPKPVPDPANNEGFTWSSLGKIFK